MLELRLDICNTEHNTEQVNRGSCIINVDISPEQHNAIEGAADTRKSAAEHGPRNCATLSQCSRSISPSRQDLGPARTMIDQDYADLLNVPPPSGDVLEWTFSTRRLATAFVSLLLGTPIVCLIFYLGMGEDDDLSDGAVLRVSLHR